MVIMILLSQSTDHNNVPSTLQSIEMWESRVVEGVFSLLGSSWAPLLRYSNYDLLSFDLWSIK